MALPGLLACPAAECRLASAPGGCPSGTGGTCSGHGACYLPTGTCACYESWTGAVCEQPRAATPAPLPVGPLFGEHAARRRMMASENADSKALGIAAGKVVGERGLERLTLTIPSSFLAAATLFGCFGMIVIGALLLLGSRPAGDAALPM